MEPVSTRDELECSNRQHRAVIAMQVLECDRLDPDAYAEHAELRDLAVKNLIEYLSPAKKKAKE